MSFLWPWALAGAMFLPILLGIYYLRRRARRRTVPSLLLWAQQESRQAAGRRRQQLESSRLLALELLLLALLVLSAMGPWWSTDRARRPLVVVLDDSLSMAAGEEETPLTRGREALARELREGRHGDVQWILVGNTARRLESPGRRPPEVWRGRASTASLEKGLELAREVGGPEARVLVVTDHLPENDIAAPWLRWWSFGQSLDNVAWVGASRRRGAEEDHVLLEVENFSARPVTRNIDLLAFSADGRPLDDIDLSGLASEPLSLQPEERRLLRWRVPQGLGLKVQLRGTSDALAVDDEVVLLPTDPSPVRVRLRMEPGPTEELLRRTLNATGFVQLLGEEDTSADLEVWGGGEEPKASEAAWNVVLGSGGGTPKPYVGPFILDTQHPLAEGLALEGVVWSTGATDAARDLPINARVVVSAGDIPLLIDRGRGADGSRRIDMRWRADRSNLQRTPNWPILWWNLLDACRQQRPGVAPRNGRLGSAVRYRPSVGEDSARLVLPDGERRTLRGGDAAAGGIEVATDQLGLHRLESGGESYAFVVNGLAPKESDLRLSASDRLGAWQGDRGAKGRHSLMPYLLLVALGLSVLHLAWSVGRRRASAEESLPIGKVP